MVLGPRVPSVGQLRDLPSSHYDSRATGVLVLDADTASANLDASGHSTRVATDSRGVHRGTEES